MKKRGEKRSGPRTKQRKERGEINHRFNEETLESLSIQEMEVISIESERSTHTPGRLIYLNEVDGLSHWDHFTALAVSSN